MREARTGLLFVVGALLVHLGLAAAYTQTIGPAHDASRMDARWLHRESPVDVMIAGASHARFGVEAEVLGPAVNVAVPGEHYGKSRFRVPWLLDRAGHGLEVVVLPFDAASFSPFKATNYSPEYVWGRYVDFGVLAREQGDAVHWAGRALKAYAAPYVGELRTVWQFATGTRHFRARQGIALGLAQIEEPRQIAARHFGGSPETFDPRMVEALRALISELRERRVRVVLVRYPVAPAYRRAAARLGVRSDPRDALLAELLQPGGVEHLDFTTVFDDRPGAFLDADHLGPRGRRAFSRLLRSALVSDGVLPSRAPLP
ncbi:MAG: hypothetical protein AAF211_14505 [Myxococcota bacterium]